MTSIGSINKFYTELASVYSAVSHDRDFHGQCQLMKSQLSTKVLEKFKYLELCAGPAEHSLAFSSADETWAIDSSLEMKNAAIAMGFNTPDRYIIGSLPNVDFPELFNNYFNIVSLLRYSIGYISKRDSVYLFQLISKMLKAGGCCFIELHHFKDLLKNLDNLEIKKRHFKMDGEREVYCTWPSGDVEWEENDLVVRMNVDIDIKSIHTNEVESYTLSSIENIYLPKEIERITSALFEYSLIDTEGTAFHGSKLVLLRKPGID